MNQSKWIFHPILIFILSIIALILSLFLYIYWYVEASEGLNALAQRFNLNPDQVLESQTWVVIVVLSILVGIILMGMMLIFIYHQKTYQIYRLQNNFINSFTHELKTPVTSLKLYLETFLRYELSGEDRKKYIRYMLSDIGRLSENISSILNIASIESKSYKGEFIESDLINVVRQFCENNKHLFQSCKINIRNKSSDEPILFSIDLSLFEMLLMNILINAIKYNNSEIPCIKIEFEKKNRKQLIVFSDNGIGLDKADIKKIFKKFYQVGKADNMSAIGSGIGLNLAQNIAKIHKGKITAKSSGKGKGTTFILTLPLKE
ncbi:MAG: HAMP domain-containing histidine kinase [Deltaproteobacteria bacterium]|nr:HAMP domain-containing histidine kinase [Deltaproteobacteria bacterium]